MLTLIEKAQESIDQEEAEDLARKLRKATFDLEDFRIQMRRLKSLGPLEGLLKLLPGAGGLKKALDGAPLPEKEMSRNEALINSMTLRERRQPELINASRRQRIARGAGLQVADLNRLLRQFEDMRAMMKKLAGGGRGRLPGGLGIPGGLGGLADPALQGTAGGGLSGEEQKKLRQKRKEERQRKKKQRR
jgi:signal recognition particle subunit SRP54